MLVKVKVNRQTLMAPTLSNPILSSTAAVSNWSPNLVPGPEWRSFEQFRVAGSTALEEVAAGSVATLQVKSKTFRILRDDDFQRVLGLASEVHRLRQGITFVVKAAKVVAKHPNDRDSMELLFHSASLLSESSILPEREGHDMFRITPEESEEHGKEGLNIPASEIPRPKL
jgi:hypothetical protein